MSVCVSVCVCVCVKLTEMLLLTFCLAFHNIQLSSPEIIMGSGWS